VLVVELGVLFAIKLEQHRPRTSREELVEADAPAIEMRALLPLCSQNPGGGGEILLVARLRVRSGG